MPRHQVSFLQKLSYRFDNLMSKGTVSLIIGLLLVMIFVVAVLSLIIVFLGIHPSGEGSLGFPSAFWMSLMRALDPGTMGGDQGWIFRVVMLIVTLFGILMISILIGLVSKGIIERVNNLRKGRSFVVEKDHVLILGWSSKIFTIISELVIANENQSDPSIVILAEKDKVEMEDEIKSKVPNTKNTRVICRSGNPIDLEDLHITNPFDTKSIIILDQESVDSDAEVIKTILAITTHSDRRPQKYHITAEIKEPKNLEIAKMVGKDEVELILSDYFIALIMVQTGRQSGLSVVYTELMDFDGDEIYFNPEKSLVGKTFKELVFAYEDSAVIGIHRKSGKVELNPPMDSVYEDGDEVITITEDDDTAIVSKSTTRKFDENVIAPPQDLKRDPEKILMLGWNQRSEIVIKELNVNVIAGSELKVVATQSNVQSVIQNLEDKLSNLNITFEEADSTDKETLLKLDPGSYDHIILQSDREDLSIQQADAQTLITLLHLRNISSVEGKDLNIVSEMLDIQNRRLAEVTKADDFIVSDSLLSLLMSQVSENKYLMQVFNQLFGSEGAGVFIKPITNYIDTANPVNFYTLLESASRQNEVAIGYRLIEDKNNPGKAHGVVVNPRKSEMITFQDTDRLIVIAEEDSTNHGLNTPAQS